MEPVTPANQLLKFELAVLRAVPGVISVASYPKRGFKPKDLNANSVMLRLQTSDVGVRRIDKHCGADCASWLEAARDVKRQLSLHLGTPVVVAAEERVRLGLGAAPVLPEPLLAELTEEDMEWIASWFDGLPDPPRSGHTCHERAPAWLTQVRYRFTRVFVVFVQVNRVLPGSKPFLGLRGRGFERGGVPHRPPHKKSESTFTGSP